MRLLALICPGLCKLPAPPSVRPSDVLSAHHALNSVHALATLIDIKASPKLGLVETLWIAPRHQEILGTPPGDLILDDRGEPRIQTNMQFVST
jgi:hypothetical protein